MKTHLTHEQIEEITEEALNAMCASVQDAIGQTDGGFAGIYFSGDNHLIKQIIKDYIRGEISRGVFLEQEGN